MNITFLIGNGFDINLGLKTRYSDFLEYYLAQTKDDSDVIKKFKENIYKDIENWSNAELAFGKYTKQFDKDIDGADIFYKCYDDFCEELGNYLDMEQSKFDLNSEQTNIFNEFKKSILHFSSHFSELEKSELNSYLNQFNDAFKYRFINFNYTETLDKFVNMLKNDKDFFRPDIWTNNKVCNVVNLYHIHGYTNKYMVFGVDNDTQIESDKIFLGEDETTKDQLIKQKINQMYGLIIDKNVHKNIQVSDLIYIYGMSIGETDSLWWNRILELMRQKKSVRVIIHCYDAPIREKRPRIYAQFVKNTKDNFIKFCDFSDDIKENIKNRIYIDNGNIFEGIKDLVSSKDCEQKEEIYYKEVEDKELEMSK